MTRLARLDGPGTVAVSDQLVAVYRAATGAPPSVPEPDPPRGVPDPDPPLSGPHPPVLGATA